MNKKLMIYNYHHLVTGFLILILVYGCAVKKYIPDDELLYTGANLNIEVDSTVTIEDKAALKTELLKVLAPEPNATFLGLRPGLHYYYRIHKDSAGFIAKFWNKRIGEKPVYLSDVDAQVTIDILRNRLQNRGFFFSDVSSSEVRDTASQMASKSYKILLPKPYEIASYQVDRDSIPFYTVLEELIKDSPLEKGSRFDLSAMKLERERLDETLKSRGYYNFNSGFLIFQADTNQHDNRKFDLYLKLKQDVPSRVVKPYKIRNVNVYPNNVVSRDSISKDTARFAAKNFIQEEEFFKPKRLDPFILIDEGDLYSPARSKATSRRLGSIGAYKFINIEYTELMDQVNGTLNYLDAAIYLSPLNKRALRAEIQAITKSNDFAGPSLALTYSNRNLFNGGEVLSFTAKTAYEIQIASNNQAGQTSLEFGLGADLVFPRMLTPVKVDDDYFEYSIPRTVVSLSGDILNRSQLYSLLSFSNKFGYVWQANKYVTHELNPLSLNYVNLLSTSTEFEAILNDNEFLKNSFEQEFIAGLTYSFTYNGMMRTNKTSLFFINSTIDIAGNSISLLSRENNQGKNEIFGLEYAQYAMLDIDFRYHYLLGNDSRIATRLFAGYGLPFGNSDVMPFSKQFFSGGAYSVRAFRTRSLGPGTYTPDPGDDRSFFDQSGNVRLEANAEYRFPIFNYLKGAFFIDAGNVWSTSNAGGLPGGTLSSNFINELGIGGGVGMRVDVQGFVIRFDLAAPFHDPSLPQSERWTFDLENPIFNFAIGYPF
jgi:outer membrane protein assembly factor BamA